MSIDSLYVNTPAKLTALVAALADCTVLAVDTEFIRERTYYPELCLIQLAGNGMIWCVDPIETVDINPLVDVLDDPRRTKIFHSARQDLEIFCNLTGRVPGPLFDTQIAAAFLGRPDQIAYAGLVEEFFQVKLDKTSSRTNWAQRPLTERQLTYAAADVLYLEGVQDRLLDELRSRDREAWFNEECDQLRNIDHYKIDPQDAWRKVKGLTKIERKDFDRAAALAHWRETTAQSRNLPRGWVLKDEKLLALARAVPQSKADLVAVDGLPAAVIRRYGDELLETVHASRELVEEAEFLAMRTPSLNSSGKSLVQEILAELRSCAEGNQISGPLIGTRRDVELAVAGSSATRLFTGWRDLLFGKFVRERLGTDCTAYVRP